MKKSAHILDLMKNKLDEKADKKIFSFISGNDIKTWTFKDLDLRARSVAAYLQKHTYTGASILILLNPGLDYIASYLGCLYAQCLAIPLFPPRNNRENHRIINVCKDAGTQKAIVASDLNAEYLNEFEKINIDKISTQEASEYKLVNISSDDVAYLQYTSGSTSTPKGIMITHKNIIENCQAMTHQFYRPDLIATGCSWLPPYHDMGLVGTILFPLYADFYTYLFSPYKFIQEPLFWLKVINDFKVNITVAPNFAFDLCVKEIGKHTNLQLDLSTLSVMVNGSEPVNVKTITDFLSAVRPFGVTKDVIFPSYGLAEATLLITGRDFSEENKILKIEKDSLKEKKVAEVESANNSVELVSCGKVLKDHKLLIVDPDSRKKLPSFHVGEIWISGPSIAKGYLHKEQETKELFHAHLADNQEKSDPYLRTGDLGFIDESAHLYVVGRTKDLIIIRGKNFYPRDIEHIVQNAHPDLIPHGGAALGFVYNGDEYLGIVHEVKRHADNSEKIFAAIKSCVLQEYQISVDHIVLIQRATLPKTSSGKIRRHAVKEAIEKNELKIISEWKSPRILNLMNKKNDNRSAQVKEWIINWIVDNTNIDKKFITEDSTFSDFGLDSIYLFRLVHEIETHFHISVDPTSIWENPTLKDLCEFIDKTRKQI